MACIKGFHISDLANTVKQFCQTL